MFVSNLELLKIKLASPDEILNWSHGEVTKPETINYRTQRPEKMVYSAKRFLVPPKTTNVFAENIKELDIKELSVTVAG